MKIARFLVPGALTVFLAVSFLSSSGSDAVSPELEYTVSEKETYGLVYMREEEMMEFDGLAYVT